MIEERPTVGIVREGDDARRPSIRLDAQLAEAELLDAAEDIGRLLADGDDFDLSPAARALLYALDEAITAMLRG
jgi:hypothetical protein